MAILHLGVLDIPYADTGAIAPPEAKPRTNKTGKPRKINVMAAAKAYQSGMRWPKGTTTGDVAEFLEDEYHVMELFFEEYAEGVQNALEHGVQQAIETVLMGGPIPNSPYLGAESEIEEAFKLFLSGQYVEELGIPGVPTKAALKGVNHRLKHPYADGNPRRPSFIDSGLYEASFRAWVEE